jgi:protein O-GlcNAc transferase
MISWGSLVWMSLARMGLILFSVSQRDLSSSLSSSLVTQARDSLAVNDTDTAFSLLAQAHASNPNEPGLFKAFQRVFERRILLQDNAVDRLGLASILLEFAEYGAAAMHLEKALLLGGNHDKNKTAALLFAARASICDWTHLKDDSQAVVDSVKACLQANKAPAVHPYKALLWPCLSLQDATAIAQQHAHQAMAARVQIPIPTPIRIPTPIPIPIRPPVISVKARRATPRKIRLGYVSPDFTGDHPLAFLMQDVFRFHNQDDFDIVLYSLVESDASPEVTKIQQSSGQRWTVLPLDATKAATRIRADNLDMLVDLCGYTGTSGVAELMASRPAPLQIAYMGFPGSTGAPYMDYLIADSIVIPPHLRRYYSENLILMPHSYFVNSHRHLSVSTTTSTTSKKSASRQDYGLPANDNDNDMFVYCCHSRPEKIDPVAFRTWLRVLQQVPDSVLWLLRSGPEMESNLQSLSQNEFGLAPDRLIFCDLAPREEHLQRLQVADLFLDTPAYNAHTVGCDCLSAGVPMVSLLRRHPAPLGEVETDKMASRVGASLLTAMGLEDNLVAATMVEYEAIMIRCATDRAWFDSIRERLRQNRESFPLLDTQRWVGHVEAGLLELALNPQARVCDIQIVDHVMANYDAVQ